MATAIPLIVAMVMPGSVFASCTPGRGPHDTAARYAITAASVTSLTGISSSITEYDPYFSGFNGAGTNATVMLVSWSPSTQWAQLGWFKSKLDGGTTKRETGIEFWVDVAHNYFQWFPAHTIGTNTWYEILFEAPSTFNFFVAGSFVSRYSEPFVPTQYQVFGETHDWVDQLPGATNAHVSFVNTDYFTGATHTLHVSTSAITSGVPTQWGVAGPTSGKYQIWDKPCTT